MYSIGIVAKTGRDLYRVRAALSDERNIKVEVFTDAHAAVTALKNNHLHTLIVLLENFHMKHVNLVGRIRALRTGIPLVFLASSVDPEAQVKVNALPGAIAMSTTGEDLSDLSGILLKLASGARVYNRISKRHRTMQTGSLHLDGKYPRPICILDLAIDGARVRTFEEAPKVGEKMRITIPLSYLKKEYAVTAEVVWSRSERVPGVSTQSHMLGFRFTNVHG